MFTGDNVAVTAEITKAAINRDEMKNANGKQALQEKVGSGIKAKFTQLA